MGAGMGEAQPPVDVVADVNEGALIEGLSVEGHKVVWKRLN